MRIKKYVLNVLDKDNVYRYCTLIFNNEDEYLKANELLKDLDDDYDCSAYNDYTDYILNGLNKHNINYELAEYDIFWVS